MATRLFARARSWFFWWGGHPFAVALCRLLWPRATAGVVVVEDQHVLAVDTGRYLMLPVGGLRYGESFAVAARREAREEAGVDVETGERIHEGANAYGGVEVFYTASLMGEELAETVSGDPTWVPLEDVADRRWRFDRDVARLIDEATGVEGK